MIIFVSKDYMLTLPNPELGDSIRVPLGTKIHRAMNGEVYSYKKSNVKAVINISFAKLSQTNINDAFQFIQNTVGEYLTYKDHEDVTHIARILTTPISFIHSGRNNRGFSLELEVGDYATGNLS